MPPPPAPSADAPDWAGTTFVSPDAGAEASTSSSSAPTTTDAPAAAAREASPPSSSSFSSPASLSYSSLSSLDIDEDGLLKPLPPASPLDVRRRVFCNRSLVSSFELYFSRFPPSKLFFSLFPSLSPPVFLSLTTLLL